ncbi:hypothetical protein MYOV011v1_p0402 [Vibrio phage 6E35.1a]|nr:hypothetical protein MYOV011v1_p0402 [Vibrio phage 6E35.1a]
MNILKLFQEHAAELIQDDDFLQNRNMYSCTQMSTNATMKAMESGKVYSSVSDEIESLQTEFRKLLREDAKSVLGFELPPRVLEDLESPYCTAFVHTACYDEHDEEYTGDEYTQRFVAARKAWLQFIIDKEA